jgi:hypothetical protein
MAVVVFALFTTCDSAAEVLVLKLASLAYVAVKLFVPAVVNVMLQVPAATVPVQLTVPSLTVTLPVGVPAPGAIGITVKLSATGCPTTEGSGESEVMVAVVLALLTTCVTGIDTSLL